MLGSFFTISSTSIHRSTMMTSLSMSEVSNYPLISTTATSLISCASISDVTSIYSNTNVGDIEYFFWYPSNFIKRMRMLVLWQSCHVSRWGKLSILAHITFISCSCLLHSQRRRYSLCLVGLALFLILPLQIYWTYWGTFLSNILSSRSEILLLLIDRSLCTEGVRISGRRCSIPCKEAYRTVDYVPIWLRLIF